MKLFKSESIYDSTTSEWVEKFWIDSEEVDSDTYFFYLDREKELEDKKLEEENKVKSEEFYDSLENKMENEGIDYEELLDMYTERIIETGGCSGCIRNVLDEMMKIFFPEEDELDENKVEDICNETDNEIKNKANYTDGEVELVCNDDCENCKIPEDVCLDICTIESHYNELMNLECSCESCVKNKLMDLYVEGKKRGWQDHNDYMQYVMDEVLED